MKKPVVLMILDGWGLGASQEGNAITATAKPNYDALWQRYAHSTLACSGEAVGLPDGQQGNSEVGHLNLGAGRVVYQDLTRINKAIREHTFEQNPVFTELMAYCRTQRKPLHLMGLVSPGGVHSHSDHLLALVRLAASQGIAQVYIHCFLDGRDVPPTSALGYITQLESELAAIGVGEIATVCGRYYAMDRDNRWERVSRAYAAMTAGQGQQAASAAEAISRSYEQGITDEFVEPVVITDADGQPKGLVQAGDGLIFINFRADRAREITRCFTEADFDKFPRGPLPGVKYVAMTLYEAGMEQQMAVAYPPETLDNTLGQVIAAQGLRQLRIAETEKYAHVTFFFNGGIEAPNPDEARVLVPSPKVATYDLQPAMSAPAVTERLLAALAEGIYDFVLINYANPDMVGHTGDFDAACQAVATVDACLGRVVSQVQAMGGSVLITADHGNAEQMTDPQKGGPFTAHTANPVPCLLVDDRPCRLADGSLQDVAPTILALLGLAKPRQMTGQSLVQFIQEEC